MKRNANKHICDARSLCMVDIFEKYALVHVTLSVLIKILKERYYIVQQESPNLFKDK